MVLRTLLTMGSLHGYGIARRIEQTSDGRLTINYGTLYPASQTGAGRADLRILGCLREQPQSPVLRPHEGRTAAAGARHPAVGEDPAIMTRFLAPTDR